MVWRLAFAALLLSVIALVQATGPRVLADGEAVPASASSAAAGIRFDKRVASLLGKYCAGCHGGPKPKAGLTLDERADKLAPEKWREVAERLRTEEMPPAGQPRPFSEETRSILAWVDAHLAARSSGKLDPGRVTLHRLNRVEYDNTIRDLVGVTIHPADDFPADDIGYGFDNIADVLTLPPIILEKYLNAAEKIVDAAFKDPASRKQIMGDTTALQSLDDARRIIDRFAGRAFRRPATPAEVDRLLRFVSDAVKSGAGFEAGIRAALEAVLVSPHFLFRVELDREPNNPKAVHAVTDFELASRLSYFLWSTMPDEALFGLAAQGKLRQRDTLEGQARRMLKDVKADALARNFAGQWLQIRNLKTVSPDPDRFKEFDDSLRNAMLRETELFFDAILREDRSIFDFLDADFTFVNERLARHYGIPGVTGEELRRVTLPSGPRGGVLTQASVLTVTSNPTRTSPVKRGKWILENVLGAPPPPPPPNAGVLSEGKNALGSLRGRMERHRADPGCASCHQRMDPLGFGLENFDAVGAWRDKDEGFPIDASGVLPGKRAFNGPAELKRVLLADRQAFAHCLAEKMLTYALGRGVELYDQPAIEHICKELGAGDYRFSRLVMEIVESAPFQMRRGD